MTYLETLVRTLPRQRRAFAAQVRTGAGQLVMGILFASVGALRLFDEPRLTGWTLWWVIAGMLSGGAMILNGGYRATKADLLLHENAALIAAVNDAINQRSRADELGVEIRFDGKQFEAEIERALDMALRDHRRGVR